MPLLHNRVEYNNLRQTLRQNASRAEIALWLKLKQRGCGGYKFRRQHGIGRYIIDLYCPELKLAVEVDGSQHFEPDAREYDRERDAWLEGLRIIVVRFTAYDCCFHLDSVMAALRHIVQRRARTTSPINTEARRLFVRPPRPER